MSEGTYQKRKKKKKFERGSLLYILLHKLYKKNISIFNYTQQKNIKEIYLSPCYNKSRHKLSKCSKGINLNNILKTFNFFFFYNLLYFP